MSCSQTVQCPTWHHSVHCDGTIFLQITPAVQNAVQVASDDLLRKYYRTFSTITIKPTQADTGKVYTCEVSGKQMVQTQTLQTTITVKCKYS